jgi:YD repeat-containing protein
MAQEQSQEYYATFGGYELPLRLQSRLTIEDAERLGTYYVAQRDEEGRLLKVTKFHDGETLFVHQYVYDAQGALTAATITNPDGKTSRLQRNAEGKLVPQ